MELSNYHQPAVSNSILHDLARVYNWQAVVARCVSHPWEARYLGPDRLNALHLICNRRPTLEVVKAVVEADVSQCEVQDAKGWTPLHYCCRFKVSLAVVNYLLKASSRSNSSSSLMSTDGSNNGNANSGGGAVRMRDFQGKTPLYYAIRYDAPMEVIRSLVLAYPDAVFQCDRQGVNPISFIWNTYALSFIGKRNIQQAVRSLSGSEEERLAYNMPSKLKERWEKVMKILKWAWSASRNNKRLNPDLVDDGSMDSKTLEWLPLHLLSSHPCHLSIWQLAVAMFPEQVSVVDPCTGRLPLHCCVSPSSSTVSSIYESCQSNYSASAGITKVDNKMMVQKLLEIYPEAAQRKDLWGKTPLSIAVKDKGWEDCVADIYHAFPEAALTRDNDGKLPLHIAVNADSSLACTVNALLKNYPDGAKITDNEGKLPLHLAVESFSDEYLTKYVDVYNVYPEAVKVPDTQQGWIPLHVACANPDVSHSMIKFLIEAYSDGVEVLDVNRKTPLMIAAEQGKDWESCLSLLLQACPMAAEIKDSRGFLPIHALAMIPSMEAMSDSDDVLLLSSMFQLLSNVPSCL